MSDSIGSLLAEALRFRDEREWSRFHTPKDLALGLQIEAGELSELLLWKTDAEIDESLRDARYHERAREELADVQMFVLYLSHRLGVNLADAVREKIAKNAAKYPVEKSRGTAKKYDALD
jgi:NTP pyrophosphatase (non-canonical NTP hydrolase)